MSKIINLTALPPTKSDYTMDCSVLSAEQKYAFNKFTIGENLFITGPGGTGKSKLIQYLIEYAKCMNKNIQVCALTGCASLLLNCNARTLHSWSGIKLAKGEKIKVINDVMKSRKTISSWKKVQILIIDEVSMMSKKIFEIIEELARKTRNSSRPFGGIQVVFTGDFFQLPPVGTSGEPDTEKFCFESPLWSVIFPQKNQIELKTIFRQTDSKYIDILMQIRKGELSDENKKILQGYVKRDYNPEEHSGCIPVKLFAIRNKTDYVNNEMFSKINEKSYEFNHIIKMDCKTYIDSGKPISLELLIYNDKMPLTDKTKEAEYIANNIPCEKTIYIKKGAVVMCTTNINMDMGICNGSQGVVINIIEKGDRNIPVVKFSNGITMNIDYHYWQSEENPCIAIGQIPLRLAWALTIHKIQGSTLSMAEIDIGHSVFEYGQIYVALSRIQSLSGLYLISFHAQKIKANPVVLEFYKNILPINQEEIKEIKTEDSNKNVFSKFIHVPELKEEKYR